MEQALGSHRRRRVGLDAKGLAPGLLRLPVAPLPEVGEPEMELDERARPPAGRKLLEPASRPVRPTGDRRADSGLE